MCKLYLTLGSVPSDEECVQACRDADYYPAMVQECTRYKQQLEQMFVDPPGNVHFGVKSFPHDFGAYCEAVVYYNDQSEEEMDFAFNVENNLPEKWDEPAAA